MKNWAERWNIPHAAIQELFQVLAPIGMAPSHTKPGGPEAQVQQEIRVLAPHAGGHMWRNNNGAFIDSRGIPVRFGLGNDSKQLNKKLKSSDLIGITPVQITLNDVGRTAGIFTASENKKPGWRAPTTVEERAQAAFLTLVHVAGGIATFSTQASDYTNAIERWKK